MSRQKNSIDDTDWIEVSRINSYAVFMGYLLMGVRGLGLLVLTWTTVVLLGGFVSTLQMKDFWCLTAITLVQTAGVFDFLLKDKASEIVNSLKGLISAVGAAVVRSFKKDADTLNSSRNFKEPSTARMVLGVVLLAVQGLVIAIVLCPLMVLYVLGLYISAGISLWRLIQHDYGGPDGGANLKPALNVLYSLAIAQGVVYGYRAIYDLAAGTGLVEEVAEIYSLEADLVSEYLEETVAGCTKDPSFVKGRNLVTYAVELLMESKTKHGYFSGVLILGKISMLMSIDDDVCKLQKILLKQLLTGSASCGHVVQRLSEIFGPRSPYSTEIRVRAASIVAIVADSMRLDQLPAQGMMIIECISSLLDTFEEYNWRPEGYKQDTDLPKEYERQWLLDEEKSYSYCVDPIPKACCAIVDPLLRYKSLVMPGLHILRKFAVNENNCRVISNTQGLLSKTMAHLIQDKFHEDHHRAWSSIAGESLALMNRIMATLGGTEATKLGSEISSSGQVIMRTLECYKCELRLKRQATLVLLHLPSIVPSATGSSWILFLWILLDIFLLPDDYPFYTIRCPTHLLKKSSYTRGLAGEKMQAMVSSETEASDQSRLASVRFLLDSLARTVAGVENNAYRIHAATILEHLCRYYTKDDQNLKELKNAMTNVMEKVLKEIALWLVTGGIYVVTQANNGGNLLAAEGLDLEQGASTPHPQHLGTELALILLCGWIGQLWIPTDQDLTRQYNDMAAKICLRQGMSDIKNFRKLVIEAEKKLIRNLKVRANSSSESTADWLVTLMKILNSSSESTAADWQAKVMEIVNSSSESTLTGWLTGG